MMKYNKKAFDKAVKEYKKEFKKDFSLSSVAELVGRLRTSQIVICGDYHEDHIYPLYAGHHITDKVFMARNINYPCLFTAGKFHECKAKID